MGGEFMKVCAVLLHLEACSLQFCCLSLPSSKGASFFLVEMVQVQVLYCLLDVWMLNIEGIAWRF
jgi:hypothetical protein